MSHPQKPTDVGTNRTGIAIAPDLARELIQGAEQGIPDPIVEPETFEQIHQELAEAAPPVGGMPAGVPDEPTSVFLDKLGERLAFERGGVRLYQALLVKLGAAQPHDTGITAEDLEEIREAELRHFAIVKDAIETLGGDPTVVTPCADVIGVASMGIVQVLTDPRTTLTQGLDAILVAELADTAGWELLVQLAAGLGHAELAERFREAFGEEQDHVRRVRAWLSRAVAGQAGLQAPAPPPSPAP